MDAERARVNTTFELLRSMLSTPRPSGSQALKEAVAGLRAWPEGEGAPVRAHPFTLYPYFMEVLGAWMAVTGVLLPIAALGRWGWGGLVVALLSPIVPFLAVRYLWPTVAAVIWQRAENLVLSFPGTQLEQEVILAAHLDSKTEFLDHHQRSFLMRRSSLAMGLTVGCGVLIALERFLPAPGATIVRWLAFAMGLAVAAYGLTMGLNLIGGRFSRRPSVGVVDDGASVAVLAVLARRLARRELRLERTTVTILLTVGEEAQMQGALAYVRDRRDWPPLVYAINLEGLGQNAGYVLWDADGTSMVGVPVDRKLSQIVERAVEAVTGEPPAHDPKITSDAYAFIRHGLPTVTLGGLDREWGWRGWHGPLDNLRRVDPDRLQEAGNVLNRILLDLDDRTRG
ncbi:MAG: M20/M25/M40 family metallo-hydrolase [Anaerolineae bacterium]|nr:MAG: M20/M25/M40 family metallo-hydrolase [Anaerolineae bacterium]